MARTAATLLRWAGSAAVAKIFQQLEEERAAADCLARIRLIGKIGPVALETARQYLKHERWYVVRNACKILGELKDPELLRHLAPALRHAEERVQHAAVRAMIETRAAGRAQTLAEALPCLHPRVLEEVLHELLFLKDPACVPGLEQFVFRQAHGTKDMMLAVQALAVIPGERVEHLLGNILSDTTLDLVIRRIAMLALIRGETPASRELLGEFLTHAADDPVASECKLTLQALRPGK